MVFLVSVFRNWSTDYAKVLRIIWLYDVYMLTNRWLRDFLWLKAKAWIWRAWGPTSVPTDLQRNAISDARTGSSCGCGYRIVFPLRSNALRYVFSAQLAKKTVSTNTNKGENKQMFLRFRKSTLTDLLYHSNQL